MYCLEHNRNFTELKGHNFQINIQNRRLTVVKVVKSVFPCIPNYGVSSCGHDGLKSKSVLSAP